MESMKTGISVQTLKMPNGSNCAFLQCVSLPPARCSYNGVAYYQGNEWNVGCDQTCRCEDPIDNVVFCAARCPTIRPQKNCILETDPDNLCCQRKTCYLSPTLFNVNMVHCLFKKKLSLNGDCSLFHQRCHPL